MPTLPDPPESTPGLVGGPGRWHATICSSIDQGTTSTPRRRLRPRSFGRSARARSRSRRPTRSPAGSSTTPRPCRLGRPAWSTRPWPTRGSGPTGSPAIGLTNQRETTVVWDRDTGRAIAPAIVWQDRRTADFCERLRDRQAWLAERTGLVLDPYFSATKIAWLLDNVPDARRRAEAGELAAGTVDSS